MGPEEVGNSQNCGPIFGGGCDMRVMDKCDIDKISYSNLYNFYDNKEKSEQLLVGTHSRCPYLVKEYEI